MWNPCGGDLSISRRPQQPCPLAVTNNNNDVIAKILHSASWGGRFRSVATHFNNKKRSDGAALTPDRKTIRGAWWCRPHHQTQYIHHQREELLDHGYSWETILTLALFIQYAFANIGNAQLNSRCIKAILYELFCTWRGSSRRGHFIIQFFSLSRLSKCSKKMP